MASFASFLKFLLAIFKVFKEVTHHLSSSTLSNTLPSTIFLPFSSGSLNNAAVEATKVHDMFLIPSSVCDQWLWTLGDISSELQ